MLRSALIGLFIIAFLPSFGQFIPGYVVKSQGDTLTGFVDDNIRFKNLSYIEFKTQKDGPIQRFELNEIDWIVLSDANVRFRSASVDIDKKSRSPLNPDPGMNKNPVTEYILAEILIDGKYDLYVYTDHNVLETRYAAHYFYDDGSGIKELGFVVYRNTEGAVRFFEEYKQQLANLFKDCPKAQNSAYNFSRKAFVTAFQKYNECIGAETKFKDAQSMKIGVAFRGSLLRQKFLPAKTDGWGTNPDFPPVIGFSPSVLISFTKKKLSNPAIFNLALGYRSTGKIIRGNHVDAYSYVYESIIAGKFITVDVGAQLILLRHKKVRPYFRGLLGPRFTISSEIANTATFNGNVVTKRTARFANDGFALNPNIGVSTKYVDAEIGVDFTSVDLRDMNDKRVSFGGIRFISPSISVVVKPFE